MAELKKFEEDLRFISKMSDYPGSMDGLSTEEFKQRFDEAAVRIQAFINDFMVPAINAYITLGTGYLRTEGGKMTGIIEMGSNRISGLGTPISDSDATPKSFVVPKSGGTMTGNLQMGGNKIRELQEPEVDSDAASKKYVDSRRVYAQIQLHTYDWTGSAPPYTLTRAFPEAAVSDTPHYGLVLSSNTETAIAEKEAFALIDDLDATDGSLVFICLEDKPSVDITVQIEIIKGRVNSDAVATVTLNNYPEQSAVSVEVDGTTYGINNASVNSGASQGAYDFTVL